MSLRSEVGTALSELGFKIETLTRTELKQLRDCIDREMARHQLFNGTLAMCRGVEMRKQGLRKSAAIFCKSRYFDRRPAIIFEHDGSISIASWADDSTVQPIIDGCASWARRRQVSLPPSIIDVALRLIHNDVRS